MSDSRSTSAAAQAASAFNPVDADMEDDDGWPVPSVDSMSEAAAPAATADAGPAPFPNIRPVS